MQIEDERLQIEEWLMSFVVRCLEVGVSSGRQSKQVDRYVALFALVYRFDVSPQMMFESANFRFFNRKAAKRRKEKRKTVGAQNPVSRGESAPRDAF